MTFSGDATPGKQFSGSRRRRAPWGAPHKVWEINSTPRSTERITEDAGSVKKKLKMRIKSMLEDWDEKTEQTILKWGDMGVKSSEYSRIVWRKAMEEREWQKLQRERNKIKAERQLKQKWWHRSTKMAERSWSRRVYTRARDDGDDDNYVSKDTDDVKLSGTTPLVSTSANLPPRHSSRPSLSNSAPNGRGVSSSYQSSPVQSGQLEEGGGTSSSYDTWKSQSDSDTSSDDSN
uniref:Uncharacterized protein n=1 Tax=Trypanosoma congolense (strain IL3000) TaxID=1068625 RepID=G0UWX3_TRYCI|nr:conserved hypothetical protein [Trypanosoma congolense IL3000]